MTRQAYLITAYKDGEALYDLVNGLDPEDEVYIHIDKKSEHEMAADPFVQKLRERKGCHLFFEYSVTWGGYSHVEAMLLLMREAIKDGTDKYIHMVTGEDMLIIPAADIKKRFTETDDKDKIYLDYIEEKDFNDEVKKRYETYFWFKNSDLRNPFVWHFKNFIRGIQKLFGVKRKSLGGFDELYKGLFYISLPGDCAKDIQDHLSAHPEYENDLKRTELPEEFFFHTLLLNDGFADGKWKDRIVRKELRYMKWDGASPVYLGESDINDIKTAVKDGYIFARKVHGNDRLRKAL